MFEHIVHILYNNLPIYMLTPPTAIFIIVCNPCLHLINALTSPIHHLPICSLAWTLGVRGMMKVPS